jgi:hypothetical protein
MRTKRLTLLTTRKFKAFLVAEAALESVSVAELVQVRCEQRTSADELVLQTLATELRGAVAHARKSLRSGLKETNIVLAELRSSRSRHSQRDARSTD